jgi:hypothetical protein
MLETIGRFVGRIEGDAVDDVTTMAEVGVDVVDGTDDVNCVVLDTADEVDPLAVVGKDDVETTWALV